MAVIPPDAGMEKTRVLGSACTGVLDRMVKPASIVAFDDRGTAGKDHVRQYPRGPSGVHQHHIAEFVPGYPAGHQASCAL